MAKYDGLIIPRSYNDYVNKSDPIGVSQALQLTGVMDNVPTAQSTKPAKSGGIFSANAVIMANNKTLSGVAISTGSVVRVLFTAALTGSDATTGLTLTYNGTAYAVKVGKDGALANFLANNIDGSYIYCQAYTTLELMFDGSQFIIMGNPVVISSAGYTIYTDGSIEYTKTKIDSFISTRGSVQRLFSGGNSANGTATLEDSINNFKEILITPCTESGFADLYTPICIPVAILINTQDRRIVFAYQNNYIISVTFSDNLHIVWSQYGSSTTYFQVYGVR